jgi:hypothetical protein
MKVEYRRINHVTIAVPAGEHKKVRGFHGDVLGLKAWRELRLSTRL